MATIEDVSRLAAALPDVVEGTRTGHATGLHWAVGTKTFAWERAFSKADLRRFGDEPVPGGPILAVVVEDLGEKQSVLEDGMPGFFTIPHFDGYAAVLVQLDAVRETDLEEALLEAWATVAPPDVARAFLGGG
ncbi:MmcQ/YjbR family DNA-binding protein [Xylanimonas protaetiae]|uniref:MmcQ/YjbR family DNA-binding protein n=1 Tax=Xylanimonas protaetiae TaxID=2509457 RepID=A0A4P6F6P9_9MICO|nr:hypothetical protein [Xylanimonas protaetiae]QAY70473.1 hypothetical protein ET471_10900 [Xylanimonas protaetiae]